MYSADIPPILQPTHFPEPPIPVLPKAVRPSVALGVPLAGLETRLSPLSDDRHTGSVAPTEFVAAVASIRRWLAVGRDVLVLGDKGSGRSTVLQEFVQVAASRGVHVLTLAAPSWISHDAPLAALRGHELISRVAQSREVTPTLLEAVLADELRGTQNVVVIDDLELFDVASLTVIERLLARPHVRLLVSTTRELLRSEDHPGRQFLAGKVPAEVRLPPLGFWGVSSLLRAHLGGPPDAGLISSVVSRSAGIPGVAVGLADAGRFSGSVQLVDGLWTEVRPLDDAPHEIVVHALVGMLPPGVLDAMELLAWTGPLKVNDALRLVGAATLADLGDRERVVLYRTSRGTMVTISPPALSRAMRSRLTDVQRQVFTERFNIVFDETHSAVPMVHSEVVDSLLAQRGEGEGYQRWSAELTGLVHERAAIQDSSFGAQWRAVPTVVNAVHFLDAMTGRPQAEQLDQVFEQTAISPSDSAAYVVRFRMHEAQWMLWRTGDLPAVTAVLRRAAAQLGRYGKVLQIQAQLFEISREGLPADLDYMVEFDTDIDEGFVRRWTVLVRVTLLLEQARAEEALDLLDTWERTEDAVPLARYLDASRSDALLFLGEYEDAESWSRARLSAAYDALDPHGIRLHSLKLAECLFLTGRQMAAWQVLSTSLRLGPPSPFCVAYYERTLALSTVIQAQAGDLALARVLQRELEDYPLTYRPVLGSMRDWAHATVLYAQGDSDRAEQVLWAAAERDLSGNLLASAALCLSARRSPYPRDACAVLNEALDRAPVPLFDSLASLHLAMANEDHVAIVDALDGMGAGVVPDLVGAALDVLQSARGSAGLCPLTADELDALTRGGTSEWTGLEDDIGTDIKQRLTNREREVALLARSGMSNREISRRLYVSVRTVENHVYRALRKLGLSGRCELRGWDPESTEPEGTWQVTP